MFFDHGTIAPSLIDFVRSGMTFHSSISIFSPKPLQAGHAPYGELKENSRGSGSWNEIPHDAQANDSLNVASVHTWDGLSVAAFAFTAAWYSTVTIPVESLSVVSI